jgi:hypothetical protein
MYALPTGKLRMQWHEPWFFKLRTLNWRGWLIRAAILACGILMCTGFANRPPNASGPGLSIPEVIGISLLFGGLFLLSLELPTFQRAISISEYEIHCVGALMMLGGGGALQLLMGMKQWNRREIKQVTLLRASESGNSFSHGVMTVVPKYASSHQIGVPRSVSLTELADRLHVMGISVELAEWTPASEEAVVG